VSFYYPLTLGIRRSKPASAGEGDKQVLPPRPAYDAWREGVHRLEHQYEEHPEGRVLQAVRQATQTQSRLWIILGEPGAGKSALLEQWFTCWAAELAAPRLGMAVPVLVHLGDLKDEDAELESEQLAKRLWQLGRDSRALLQGMATGVYRDWGEWCHPVWFLDGLDEVPEPLLSVRFYQKLTNLPGPKVLTCRTAVYESLHRDVGLYKEKEYELLGLKPREQEAFLEQALSDARRAKVLHHKLRDHPQLRFLAPNPLMLTLIAEVSGRIQLPATHAEFCQEAISEMWDRRMKEHYPALRFETGKRDRILTELVRKMGVRISAPLAWLEEAAGSASLIKALSQEGGGLLQINRREQFSFLHLTFQEFYLARALQMDGLPHTLVQRWDDARYEETLALLIAQLFHEGQYEPIEAGICKLVKWAEETHREDPHILWQKRRSPLRVVLHLLHRAGVTLDKLPQINALIGGITTPPGPLLKLAKALIGRDPLLELAIANDTKAPSELLARLAQDEDRYVRWSVAQNPSTPPESLARLAQDKDRHVRWDVAQNPSTLLEDLR
jgi:hypothetical protein